MYIVRPHISISDVKYKTTQYFFNSISGDFVVGVTAVDQDIGVNGQVAYELSGSDGIIRMFDINSRTGVITARTRLRAQRYQFTVLASDMVYNTVIQFIPDKVVT